MITIWLRRLASPALAAALLAGCGGGVGSGGTGDMASGQGVGTITGFGSVIVDGERYDDAAARFEYDTEAGAPDAPGRRLERADLALGQRVELDFEVDGQARRASVFRISPALIGPVTSLSPLSVAGQALRLNADAARGPVTRFGGGLASAQQIQLGDRLEVHGVPAPEGDGSAIQATRLDRRPASHGKWLRLSGTVSDLAPDGRSFRLGALRVTLPARGNGGLELAEGLRVQVWTRGEISGNALQADRVRIDRRQFAGQESVQLSGAPAACPDRARSAYVCIGATPVALDGASFDDGLGAATLTERRYVIVNGRFDAASGAVNSARFSLPRPQ